MCELYPVFLGIYFALCMLLLMISLTESVLIVRLVHKKNLCPQVPGWMKKLILNKMARVLLIGDRISPSGNNKKGTSVKTENIHLGKVH